MKGDALLIGLLFSGIAGYLQYRNLKKNRGPGIVPRVDEEFRQVRFDASDPRLAFDGRTARVVHEWREYADRYQTELIRITRYARNPHGEYFYFMSEGKGNPLFRHISQAAAQAALGKKYVAPPHTA
ncbi:hypothetical protein LQ564_20195 [Massilia sp. G4R7]|uniref:Uncharacterized protein n=1 Tax=Massilia phyllostachyos TaxID=2898585 RepID=A0ABS8QA47_9BURK|nr:hypothetical protein [Massilia phyllostachyos]MCD2518623.1 hypothetical protein [Massilia phyllostachyos]